MDPDLIGYLASGLVLLTFTAKKYAYPANFGNLEQFCVHLLWNHWFHYSGSVPAPDFATAECHPVGPATALLRPPRERVSGTPAHMAWVVTTAGNPVKGAGGSTDQSYLRCASVQ